MEPSSSEPDLIAKLRRRHESVADALDRGLKSAYLANFNAPPAKQDPPFDMKKAEKVDNSSIDSASCQPSGEVKGMAEPAEIVPSAVVKPAASHGATVSSANASLDDMRLDQLKSHAAALGIMEPPGHKGHKKTWIAAIERAESSSPSKLDTSDTLSSAATPIKAAFDTGVEHVVTQSQDDIVASSVSPPIGPGMHAMHSLRACMCSFSCLSTRYRGAA